MEGIGEFPALVRSLRSQEKKPAVERVWEMLSNETKTRVLDEKVFEELGQDSAEAAKLMIGIQGDFTGILGRSDFFREQAFKAFLLTNEQKELVGLGKKRTAHQTAKLNWALLEKTFPSSIPEMPKQFRTIRVNVVRGKEVVLVLSSYEACLWDVKLLEGARVAGVILCGRRVQEVRGVDAPVLYRALYGPDGVIEANREKYLYAYQEGSDQYKSLAAAVKEITGKEFTSFRFAKEKASHRPEPGEEPFTVFPKAEK
jgi:hypothetical protein